MMVQASILFVLLLLLNLDVFESLSDDRRVRDNAVCDLMHSTNVPELCSSNTWQGWNCSGSAGKYEAIGLCSHFWTGIVCSGMNVTEILFENKGLTGTIPSSLGLLTTLKWIDLTSNKFHGSIPSSLGKLSNLIELTVAENQLTSTLPNFEALSDIVNLDITNNLLRGKFPSFIGYMKNLQYLTMSENSFSGSIFPSVGLLSQLRVLSVSGNSFTGSIPPSIGDLRWLESLELDSNSLTSSLPSSLGSLHHLEALRVQENSLTGNLPISLLAVTTLRVVEAYGNNLTKENVDDFCAQLPHISVIALVPTANSCQKRDEEGGPVRVTPSVHSKVSPGASLFSLLLVLGTAALVLLVYGAYQSITSEEATDEMEAVESTCEDESSSSSHDRGAKESMMVVFQTGDDRDVVLPSCSTHGNFY